jgi:hypothetical protein
MGCVSNLVVARGADAGLGHALMTAAADALRALGASEWKLDVNAHDANAIELSEQLGMRAEHRSTVLRFAWADIAKLPAELATVTPAAPYEDEDLERAFELPSGRLAMARRPGRFAIQLRDADLLVLGFAVFDAALPGATVARRAPRPRRAAARRAARACGARLSADRRRERRCARGRADRGGRDGPPPPAALQRAAYEG